MQLDNENLEKIVCSMFRPPCTEEYKILVIGSVFYLVKRNSGITVNSVKRKLCNQFGFTENDIDTAIAALSNPNIFGCISRFQVEKYKKAKPIHLRPRSEGTEFWKYWIEKAESKFSMQTIMARS